MKTFKYSLILVVCLIVGLIATEVHAQCFGARLARVGRVVTAPVRFVAQRRPVLNALSKLRGQTFANCSGTAATCSGSTSVVSENIVRYESSEVKYVTTANIDDFAAELNRSGRLYHDPGYYGRENVYRSSGVATEQAAINAWMRSPGHRANMPFISNIKCVGNVCVGR